MFLHGFYPSLPVIVASRFGLSGRCLESNFNTSSRFGGRFRSRLGYMNALV